MKHALFAVLTLAACGDDNNNNKAASPDAAVQAPVDAVDTTPRTVEIKFAPKVGTAAFACGQTYAAMGNEATTITPKDFRFYVSAVKLQKSDGTYVGLALTPDAAWQADDVALLDFEDFTGGCTGGTAETNLSLKGTVPAGTYTGIAFDIGPPDAMNHVDMTTQPAPLNTTSLWWGWGLGHVFFAAVTHTDITTPTPGINDHYIHVGSTGCSGDPTLGEAVTCTKPNHPHIELSGFDPTAKAITADYGAVIAKSDLTTSVGCHSFSEDTCAYPFDLVGLNFYTGSQTPTTQKVFRVDP